MLQLDVWGLILPLGLYWFFYTPWIILAYTVYKWVSIVIFSQFCIWCSCFLDSWCIIHPLPLRGVVLGPCRSGNIVVIYHSMTCVLYLYFIDLVSYCYVWNGWFHLGWMGVWIWRMIVDYKLLCQGWGKVILVLHYLYGSSLMMYMCLVWGVTML